MEVRCVFDALSAEAVVGWGNHPGADEDRDELDVPNYLDVLGKIFLSYAPHLPIDDSCIRLISAWDAVTFRPRYNSRNQYSFINKNARWGALAFSACVAGLSNVTSHSARNSIIFASKFGRIFSTSSSAGATARAGMVVGLFFLA